MSRVVLVGCLLVAVVCLALGLVLTSAGWLIASLAASAAAAWLLWHSRDATPGDREISARDTTAAGVSRRRSRRLAVPVGARAAGPGTGDYARRGVDIFGDDSTDEPVGGTMTDPTTQNHPAETAADPADDSVWVIDGRPNYHTAHCGVLLGANGEPIPRSQAVEDGFTPCTLCDPDSRPVDAAPYAAPADPLAGSPAGSLAGSGPGAGEPDGGESAAVPMVWVVDGWPHYHEAGCRVLTATGTAETVPFAQAVDDGFTPCPACRAADAAPADDAAAPDGQPRATIAFPEPDTDSDIDSDAEPDADEPATDEPAGAPAADPLVQTPDDQLPDDQPPDDQPPAGPVAADDEHIGTALTDAISGEAIPDEPVSDEVVSDEVEPVSAALSTRVWVVAGRPRYHLADCVIVDGQGPTGLPASQALAEGFKPCSLCEPPSA